MRVFANPGTTLQETVPTRKDGGKNLFDDFILTDDHLLQLFLHDASMLAEFLENVAQAFLLGCHVLIAHPDIPSRGENSATIQVAIFYKCKLSAATEIEVQLPPGEVHSKMV